MKDAKSESLVQHKSSNSSRLYYYLIGFNIFIILLTLIPLHSYSRSYTQTVRENYIWGERINKVTQLSVLVTTMHNSSISVLNSGNIGLDKDQLETANQQFQEVVKSVRGDLSNINNQIEAVKLDLTVGGIQENGYLVYRKASEIIQQVETELPVTDPSQINQLDQSVNKSLNLINSLCQELQDRQSQQIDSQTVQADSFECMLLSITASLCLIFAVSLWYGHQLVISKEREDELNKERLEILLTTKESVTSQIAQIHNLSRELLTNKEEPNRINTIKQIDQQADSLLDMVFYMIKKVRPDQPDLHKDKSHTENTNPMSPVIRNDAYREVSNIQLNCRVLTADDGPNNLKFNCFVLKKSGADVVGAENGHVAIDLALNEREKGEPFDLILMDMQMPVLDGFQATRKLREKGFTIPIIALTGSDESGDKEKCLAAGCDDFITKPVSREKLIQVVAQYTSQLKTV
ncbi:MAG: response regulator [Pirellulales bacterium]